jgi:CheY-like chemotaxis protein
VEESDELRQTSVVSLGKSGLTAGDCQYIRASSTVDLLDQMALCLLKKESLMKESSRVHSAPMRVLLAEDNEVNQKLALRLLEAAGHHVTVAETGHRALQCFRTDTFDLILMDVQMPGLSGYECVAEIRRLENRRGERVPILATTTHAMKGAREQCLNAGMDGYLSKPFRRDELFQAIDEVMSRREVANRSTSSPGANLPPEVIADLLVIFQETRDRMLGEIQSAIDGADPVAVARAAHSIRGALSVFEAPRSIAAAHRLEKAATDKDLFDAAQMFSELQDSLAELGAEVGTKAEAARV